MFFFHTKDFLTPNNEINTQAIAQPYGIHLNLFSHYLQLISTHVSTSDMDLFLSDNTAVLLIKYDFLSPRLEDNNIYPIIKINDWTLITIQKNQPLQLVDLKNNSFYVLYTKNCLFSASTKQELINFTRK